MISFFSVNKYLGEKHSPIIVWGAGYAGRQLLSMYEMEYMNYNVVAIADNDLKKHGLEVLPQRARNINPDNLYCQRKIPVVSAEYAAEYCRMHRECIIVVAVFEKYKCAIFNQISEMNLQNTVVYMDEFKHFVVREYIDCCIKKYSPLLAFQYYSGYYMSVNHVLINKYRPLIGAIDLDIPFVTIVSPPKTGGNTVSDALAREGIPHIHYHNGSDLKENPEKLGGWVSIIRDKCKKYIIGVREPVSQNISLMFNQTPNFFSLRTNSNNLDAQWLFDNYVEAVVMGYAKGDSIYEHELMSTGTNFIEELYIQSYFQKTIKTTLGIDVYQSEFDKERGYSVVRQDGKDIFLYQIEKLKTLKQELAEFLEVPSLDYGVSNDGSKKYYHHAYTNFLNEFVMSEKYYEYSYSCKFMKHFYSDKDIDKYKTKWIEHVI